MSEYLKIAVQAVSISFIVGLCGVACVAPFFIAAKLMGVVP